MRPARAEISGVSFVCRARGDGTEVAEWHREVSDAIVHDSISGAQRTE
jgi:hypothetical protein